MHDTSLKTNSPYQIVQIPLHLRWQVWKRLQDLSITSWCPSDGHLYVEIDNGVSAVQLRSVVQQFRSSRPELLDWLEHCWQLPVCSC